MAPVQIAPVQIAADLPAAKPWTPAVEPRTERARPDTTRAESPRLESARVEPTRSEASLFSRASDSADAVAQPPAAKVRKPYLVALGMAFVMVGIFEVVIRYVDIFGSAPAKAITASELPATSGTLAIDSTPKAKVYIDEALRGETPLRLDLPAGQHRVRLEGEGAGRTFQLNIIGGKEISQLVELSRTAVSGVLEVKSEPSGARVLIDGRSVGVSPITVPDLKPGVHALVVDGPNGSIRQAVQITAGATASVLVPLSTLAANVPAGGWVSIDAPEELQVYEGGRLLGTTRSDRIMVPAGNHDFELRNDAIGFSTSRSVQVQGGKVAKVVIALPDGSLSLNATPWAEVWIDGQRIGETPVGNVAVRAGSREVVFRHPQHGEVRQTVVVKAGDAGRVTVNMAK